MSESKKSSRVFVVVGAGLLTASMLGLGFAPFDLATAAPAPASATSTDAIAAASDSPAGDPTVMETHRPSEFVDDAAGLPAGLGDAVERDLDLTAAEYLASAAAASDALAVLDSLDAAGVGVIGSRLSGTQLVVNVASPEDADAVADAGATAELSEPETVDLSGIEFVPAVDVAGGDGYAWSSTDGSSRQCSIGLTGYRVSDGRQVALTAGHCVGGMSTITGAVRALVQTAPGDGGSFGSAIGSPGAARFGGGFDGGLITLDAAGVAARGTVLTWGGGAGAPRSSAAIPVTDVSAAIVGANLCKSGSRTGWTCGTVRAVDQSVNVGGNLVNSIIATTCIQPGDSGGPALIGSAAVGVNSSTSSAACGTSSYFSAFFPMVSTAGAASVQSQFGAVWEPAVTLSAPSITTMTVPADGTPNVLSGTLPAAASAVTVFVDGAATPSLTMSAAGGSWSVDLSRLTASGVASGSHRVTVVAQRGNWSRSTGTDATIGFGGSPAKVTEALIPPVFVQR